jgi:CRP-like cAMP-binding protein
VALLGGAPYAADAEALEDSLLLELRHADFDEWVMAHPPILTSMLRALERFAEV